MVFVVVTSAATAAGGVERGRADSALLTRCVNIVLGTGSVSFRAAVGSADPGVISSLGVFQRKTSPADQLPATAQLRELLAFAGARSYDPSAAVRVSGRGARESVYAVPAMMLPPPLPAGCAGLRQLAGLNIYLALRAQETGSGAGVCLFSTALIDNPPPSVALPGAPAPKPTKMPVVAGTLCRSEAVLSGYLGALANALGNVPVAVIPGGVSAITYTLADGQELSASVAGNLARPPAGLSTSVLPISHPTAARLTEQLTAQLPTSVTESGTGAQPTVTLTRPASLIPDIVGNDLFVQRLLNLRLSPISSTTTGGSSSISEMGASCSARTHRCVAVTVATTCDKHEHCQTTRTIHRYRYVGARPPAGTTGPDTQPTGPIVARANRLITRAMPTLVLSGAIHRHVVVLLSVSCFSRNSEASSGGPPLQVTVPSRTPIQIPPPVARWRACDVGALIISNQRGSVHATVTRG
jgi:hypothetical protein